MTVYALGDQVELAAELGGTIGRVVDWHGGPGPEGEYIIEVPWGVSDDNDGAKAGPGQIVAGPFPAPPAPILGQAVTLAGRPGTVTALGPGDLVEIEIEVELTRLRNKPYFGRTMYVRRHLVPSWRIFQEN